MLTTPGPAHTFPLQIAIYLGNVLTPISLDSEPETKSDDIYSTTQPSGQKLISADEVAKHNTRDDCWVIISGQVYDVTDFLEMHPGGVGVILQQAGQDATLVI